ncbi:hypothetical protein BYT27DRAFT_7262030 [Phlegmacium glaucopus]|nr:hypothetical protein BYT27DRAFT_7262030 [Phlegmacium glaucopus]
MSIMPRWSMRRWKKCPSHVAKKEVGVKVNKALTEKILQDKEKAQKRAEKRNKFKDGAAMDVDMEAADIEKSENKGDNDAHRIRSSICQVSRGKTVVEEDEESDNSSDGLSGNEDQSQDDDDKSDLGDSSDEGEDVQSTCTKLPSFGCLMLGQLRR